MLRRLALTSFLLLFDKRLLQIEVALLLGMLDIIVTQHASPHWDEVADHVQYGCGWIVLGCMISLVLMSYDPPVFNQLLMSLALVGAVLALAAYEYIRSDGDGAEGDQGGAGLGANQVMPIEDDGPAEAAAIEGEAAGVDNDGGGGGGVARGAAVPPLDEPEEGDVRAGSLAPAPAAEGAAAEESAVAAIELAEMGRVGPTTDARAGGTGEDAVAGGTVGAPIPLQRDRLPPHQEQIQALRAALARKDLMLANKEQVIANSYQALANKEQVIADKDQVIAGKDREIRNLIVQQQQQQHQGGPGRNAPVDAAPASGASSGLPSVYGERQGSSPSAPRNRPLSMRALEALASNKLGFIFGKPSFRTATVTAYEHEEGDIDEVSFDHLCRARAGRETPRFVYF